jgi:3-hydroxybutyryl-CoA dehydrogenase
MSHEIRQVAVIGAGIMGYGIGQVCAQAGKKVVLVDSSSEVIGTAKDRIGKSLEMLSINGFITGKQVDSALANISLTTRIEEVGSVDVVFEAIPERLDLKQQLFAQLDNLCGHDTVFASNTSAIPITRLAAFSCYPERVIGTHFYNPAQLIPLVEVITTDTTSPVTRDLMMEFLAEAGKKPVHVAKDIPGFIGNRLQTAIAREAISLVQKGVATSEDIDAVVKHSIALRMLFSGPLEQRDLNGLDTHIAITETLYPDLEDAKEPLPILREMVTNSDLGLKTGKGFYDWTGKDMAAVTKHKSQQLVNLLKFLKANS